LHFVITYHIIKPDENKIKNHCLTWIALSIYAVKISPQNHYIFTTLLCHEFSFYHTFVPISTVVIW